ncbi:MAG: FCD domain-containing protein [Actinomycetota bacterium]|nr:FCD domain-containing protein [Actinomycetota bacterium]
MAYARTPVTPPALAGQPTRAYEALLRPVRQGNSFEETVERLLQVVRLGIAPVGERLPPERDLALRLGVSRATVRAAIAALQRAGYVESRRGRYGGTFVLQVPGPARLRGDVPVDDLEDALAMRHAVEVGATECAAGRQLGPAEVEHLLTILAATSNAEPREYRRADSRLHLALAELSGSASLTAAVADAKMRVNGLLDAIPLIEANIRHSDAQHRRIVGAVLTGTADEARRAMAEHLDGTAALLRGFLG